MRGLPIRCTVCPEMNELLKPHSEIDPEWGNIVEPETQEESSLLQVLGKNTIFSRLQKHELEQLVDIVHVLYVYFAEGLALCALIWHLVLFLIYF